MGINKLHQRYDNPRLYCHHVSYYVKHSSLGITSVLRKHWRHLCTWCENCSYGTTLIWRSRLVWSPGIWELWWATAKHLPLLL